MAKLKEVFTAEVRVQYTHSCEHCDFGHSSATKHTTEEKDNYQDALDAGVEFATKHGGGIVTVNKVTEVDCGSGAW